MGDTGDFWNDVKAARKAAGLPNRKRHRERAQKVNFTAAHKKAGWVKRTDWHWQMKLPGGLLDYWPSKSKWMWEYKIKIGPFSDIEAFIASNPQTSSEGMKSRAHQLRKRPKEITSKAAPDLPFPVHDHLVGTRSGWQLPCGKCGGGLFWRACDDDPWTCDRCQKFKGRGLGISWLTTPAWAAEIERLSI